MTLPLVHIGMAKAASTFLQLELFPSAPGIKNIGKHKVSDDLRSSIQAINRRVSTTWRDNAEVFAQPIRDEIEAAKQQGLRPVLSDEDFSVFKFLDPEFMARRLRDVMGPYDVLLIVREPLGWLRSNYLFRLQHQNPIAVFGFEEWLRYHFSPQRIGSDVGELWFASLAEIYAEVSGGQDHILSYDLLKKDKKLFGRYLADILGVPENDVMDLLDVPPKSAAHKIAITQKQRLLFETFRWIETRQPAEFVRNLTMVSEDIGVPLGPAERDLLNSALSNETTHRSEWAKYLHKIVSKVPNDGEKPKLDFPPDLEQKISANYSRNLKRVHRNSEIKKYF